MSLPLVLVVDDNPENLTVIGELLQPGHAVRAANGGERALRLARLQPQPDLILLDVMMPDMDGYEVLQHLRGLPDTAHIPVIFLTALNSPADEERGLRAGAVDYITKPIRPPILLARVHSQLQLKQARDQGRQRAPRLDGEARQQQDMAQQQLSAALRALGLVAEARLPNTAAHLLRVQAHVHTLGRRLQQRGQLASNGGDDVLAMMVQAAAVHDLGQALLPESVLLNPDALSPAQWEMVRAHPAAGARLLAEVGRDKAWPALLMACAQQVARHHHERWDGSGYPDGLAGEAIPLAARLLALADAFDALVTPRVYRPRPLSPEAAYAVIVQGRGSQFDPAVVDAFVEGFDDFLAATLRHPDTASGTGTP